MLPHYRMESCAIHDILKVADILALPRYQRPYVWSEEDACAFIDTILMGLPIGAVILREIYVSPGRSGKRLLVIDGQQRISTLLGRTLGNGGKVHDVCVEADPTAKDDPVRALGSGARAVIGVGPGRIPIGMLSGSLAWQAIPIAAAGHDPTVYDDWQSCGVGPSIKPYANAVDLFRSANIPWLTFDVDATDAQVAEAFRRMNIGGISMTKEDVERLLEGGAE